MALGIGMILTLSVFYFLVESGNGPGQDATLSSVFSIVVPVLGVMSFVVGKYLYKQGGTKSKAVEDISKKFVLYQTHCLIVWALLEGAALFAAIVYLITADPLFLVFFAMIFAGYVLSKPSVAKFQQDF
ncbi:MAG TPA: hypothetical protein VNB90_02080 [Cytophagaceae bacterium]|nr:hypothetical protein [Cytophagaceae bacterium]